MIDTLTIDAESTHCSINRIWPSQSQKSQNTHKLQLGKSICDRSGDFDSDKLKILQVKSN